MKKINKYWQLFSFFIIALYIIYAGLYLTAYFTPKLAINAANSFYLYDKDDKLFSTNQKDWVNLDDISPYLIEATISIEDKHFFKHLGFDYLRILKALYVNITNGKTMQGASTITQQYAKNLFLDFDQKLGRKIEEAWLTLRLETHYPKNTLLEGYLNTINYGGIFGIENASKYYFNKHASELTLEEASILAGIPKGPSIYSPFVDENAAKERQYLILDAMVKNKYITEEEKDMAYETALNYRTEEMKEELSSLMYYQDAVIDELKTIKAIPSSFLKTGGLKIYTNLDLDAQKAMDESVKNNLSANAELEVAGIMVEPKTGKVIALTGGRDYSKSQFNRATQAKRQVGSTLKPFLYYTALESGFTASTTFTSAKTTFVFNENLTYTPSNYGNTYPNKPISMATALAYSDNIYAVKTHLFLGEEALVETAKKVGIKTKLSPIPSLALGSIEISLLEMMGAYATLANEGYKIEPYLINRIEDIEGNVLYEHDAVKEGVLNKSIVYILNELLNNCYSNELIDYSYPTCISIAAKLKHKFAIKTGSTDTDHLIFGFNKDVLGGVWTGYDDNKETTTKDGSYNKNIWADMMEAYLKDKEDAWYQMPKNVVGVLVNPLTGKPATNANEKKKILYYIKGTEPTIEESELDPLIPTIKE